MISSFYKAALNVEQEEDNTRPAGNKWNIESGHFFKATSHGFNLRFIKSLREEMTKLLANYRSSKGLRSLLYPQNLFDILRPTLKGWFSSFWSPGTVPAAKALENLDDLFGQDEETEENLVQQSNQNSYNDSHTLSGRFKNAIKSQCDKLKDSFDQCTQQSQSFLNRTFNNARNILAGPSGYTYTANASCVAQGQTKDPLSDIFGLEVEAPSKIKAALDQSSGASKPFGSAALTNASDIDEQMKTLNLPDHGKNHAYMPEESMALN